MKKNKIRLASKLIHGGDHKDAHGSAVVPIYQTSTFAFENADHGAQCFSGESNGYIYSRIGNPTIKALEKAVAWIENGYDGIATGSGMGAISTVYMGLLSQGAHLVSHDAIYGPARGIIESIFPKFGIESTYVDATQLENIEKAIRKETKMIYIETPANPTMGIIDIEGAAAIAHKHGLPLVVDKYFLQSVSATSVG